MAKVHLGEDGQPITYGYGAARQPLSRQDVDVLSACGSHDLAKIAARYVTWDEKYARASLLGKLWMRFLRP